MMFKSFLLVVLLAVSAEAWRHRTNHQNNEPIVITKHGVIRGVRENVANFKVDKYLGIPYATVPRRFVYSKVNDKHFGVLNATKYGPICPQPPFNNQTLDLPQDEDCLTLNIWRPAKTSHRERLLPVLFWIHGSAYQWFFGAENSGDYLAPYGNMIVVTFNYRLGSLGFAYGDGKEIQGNQGFSDVITALKWVHQNIQYFGGDPEEVTLGGFSAGSMMASIIPVLSEISDDLYSRVYLLSGVQVGPFLIESTSTGLAKTLTLASKVGCGNVTSLTNEVITCLRNVNATTLIQADNDPSILAIGGSNVVPFLPVYGTPLIRKPLTELFKERPEVKKTTILTFIEQDEQGFLYGDPKPANRSDAFEKAFAQLSFVKKDLTKEQMQPFFEYYFTGNDSASLQIGLANFVTAYTWECPSIILSEQYSQYHSVRFGIFKYNLDRYAATRPAGPHHNDELELLFGQPFYRNPYTYTVTAKNFEYTQRDKSTSLRFMKQISDYVHGKNPDHDWPELNFNRHKPEKEPTVRIFDVHDSSVKYSNQRICLEWSKLLGFSIL